MAHIRPYAPLRMPLDRCIAKRTFWMSLCGGFVQHPRAPPEPTRGYPEPPEATRKLLDATRGPPQDHGKRPEATGSFQSQPGTTKCRQKATRRRSGGQQNSTITREVLRKGRPLQEARGATRSHQKPPEGHLKVTLRLPGAPRGPQRPPEAIPTRISHERCCEKKSNGNSCIVFPDRKTGRTAAETSKF